MMLQKNCQTAMADQATLLQLIQFVGLIAPALAILIELLVGFHGGLRSMAENKEVPREVLILFVGFGMILTGGMVIGFQLISTIEGQLTQLAVALLFVGLPFMALSILGVNLRIYGATAEDRSLTETALMIPKMVVSNGFPLFVLVTVFWAPPAYFEMSINSLISWWIFNNTIEPVFYSYSVSALLSFKVVYSLWSHNHIPNTDVSEVIEPSLQGAFVVGLFWLLFSTPVFAAYYVLLALNVPFVNSTSLLSSIPFIWGGLLSVVLLSPDLDPID